MNFSNPETQKSKQSTDGLSRFIVKFPAYRRRHFAGWLYLTQICQMENYHVRKFQHGENRDRAQRMGKLQAEQVAASLKCYGAIAEPEVEEKKPGRR